MKIFGEVASKYDIDGIEFDFRRWFHMVSNPEKNHVVLTRLVREARKMLDETAPQGPPKDAAGRAQWVPCWKESSSRGVPR